MGYSSTYFELPGRFGLFQRYVLCEFLYYVHGYIYTHVLINTNIQHVLCSGPTETRCAGNELGNPICTFCYYG